MEAAHFAIRYEPQIAQFYQRKRASTKMVVAVKAVAHKQGRTGAGLGVGSQPSV